MSRNVLQNLLDHLREQSTDEHGKGRMFEKLIASYLMKDPQYGNLFEEVWRWNEWPHCHGQDVGIDLVARERMTGDYWAVQCKFFEPSRTINKPDIDSFLSASGRQFSTREGTFSFAHRLVVSTTDKWNRNAENVIKDQTIPVQRIGLDALEESAIDWEQFNWDDVNNIPIRPKKDPYPHQQEAIDAVLKGFEDHDRGKMIMACGTGKTFTSLRLAEELVPQGGTVLFLTPSISLVAQTLREWTTEAQQSLRAFVVCSDSKVGRNEEDMRIEDLAYPATTDAHKLARSVVAVKKKCRTVIFSTYQSIGVVSDAQNMGIGAFDLVICDEAHRTAGATLQLDEDLSAFVMVHENDKICSSKRLYMTATPRIYTDASKVKANERGRVLYSMDDKRIFGHEFYRLNFGEATEAGLLSEYRVLIVAVEQDRMSRVANHYNYKFSDKKAIDISLATKIIGSWKGLSKKDLVVVGEGGEQEAFSEDPDPMRRAVAFSRSIKNSKQMQEVFGHLLKEYIGDSQSMMECDINHVDGNMNALERVKHLDWLKDDSKEDTCRILSNARCLSEGVDVPALDSVIFFDTRESVVDIVQSVGRVMRKAPNKKYGYVILPVCMPSKKAPDYNDYIENDPQFRGIWKVVKALRSHDESLVDEAEFRRKIRVIKYDSESEGSKLGGDTQLDLLPLPLEAISEAVYGIIPDKLGDREYWSKWAKDIAAVADRLKSRINGLIKDGDKLEEEFGRFIKGLQNTLNPSVKKDEAIEMLAQHILTVPIFEALFSDNNFPENNAVGRALEQMVKRLGQASVSSETERMEMFYTQVRERVKNARSDGSKQEVVRNLYDTFFHNAFPRMAKRLGIVYTPVPVVDFIINSADAVLQKHFGENLSSPGVQILDPFAGTGTFLVRLIQSGLIDTKALPTKYAQELHANEIVLLAYYIATINIETAYHSVTNQYKPFEGMVLTDSFQITEEDDLVDKSVLPENNERAERQLEQPIRVILGNPPYSAQQSSENDDNKNLPYPTLDRKIRESYAKRSSAQSVRSLYDSYVRALRWASDLLHDRGIVAFVTNGSFLEANNMDGLRLCLTQEYSHLYIFNLRGNQRTSGEESKKEGGKIFGSGSRTPVAITIMVKDTAHSGDCELRYHDIGDYLSREEKLNKIEEFGSIDRMDWERKIPNKEGDWINQRNPDFETFILLGNKKKGGTDPVIFRSYSQGIVTSRDAWAYNSDKHELAKNMKLFIRHYNAETEAYAESRKGATKSSHPPIKNIVNKESQYINWSRSLLKKAASGKKATYDQTKIRESLYRPFSKRYLYYDRQLNECIYQIPKIFPTPEHKNTVICVTGRGANKGFSALVSDITPDYEMISKGQCFPLYWYEKPNASTKHSAHLKLGNKVLEPDVQGYIRHDAITDWALEQFHKHYQDPGIYKEDLFWYIYGILHSIEYRERFANSLKRMLPRIPLAHDFWAFSKAGENLAQLHINYEIIKPYPIEEERKLVLPELRDLHVHKILPSKKEKTSIKYNDYLTWHNVPPEAYEYVVNGKSAIEWVMECYAVSTDRASGIQNDPNNWCQDPDYIINLFKRIVQMSVQTVDIVKQLPPLKESKP